MSIFDKFQELLQREKHLREQNAYYYLRELNSSTDANIIYKNKTMINYASNNYLGLANHPKVVEAAITAIKKYGVGTGGSRILCGTLDLHNKLEQKIARIKGAESAAVFTTGYMTNLGLISTLIGPKDVVIIDKKSHASIIDGSILSKGRIITFIHNDMSSLETKLKSIPKDKNILITTDGVFSMDGDIAPVPRIIELAKRNNASVMIDEAHSFGVIGKTGRGIQEYYSLKSGIDINIGTMSKSLGSLGGYVTGSKLLIDCLKQSSRSFIFATSLPAAIIAAASAALDIIMDSPELVQSLWKNINHIKKGLNDLGYNTGNSNSAIIPVIIGDETKTNLIARFLEENGIFANPVSYPAVAKKKEMIRISMMATHTEGEINKTLDIFRKAKGRIIASCRPPRKIQAIACSS
jgi:8-amino-7-oxononanoate synthase